MCGRKAQVGEGAKCDWWPLFWLPWQWNWKSTLPLCLALLWEIKCSVFFSDQLLPPQSKPNTIKFASGFLWFLLKECVEKRGVGEQRTMFQNKKVTKYNEETAKIIRKKEKVLKAVWGPITHQSSNVFSSKNWQSNWWQLGWWHQSDTAICCQNRQSTKGFISTKVEQVDPVYSVIKLN